MDHHQDITPGTVPTTEATLAEHQERFALAMACMNDGIWDWRVDTGEVYFSPRYKVMLGYGEAEFPDRFSSFQEHLHPEDLAPVLELVQRFIEDADLEFDTVFRMRHRDGHYLWIRARATAARDQQGRARRLVGCHTDISAAQTEQVLREYNQRLEAEVARHTAALRRSEALLDTCQAIAGIGGWETNILTGEQRWTRTTYEIFELPEDFQPTLEKTVAMMDPDTPETALHQQQAAAVAALQPFDVEMPFITASGRRILVRSIGHPISEDGKVTRYVGILKDITAERAAEQALIQARDEAETARQSAEIANHAKSTFLANMSHELRTPLNGILGYAQILQRDRLLAERQREGVDIILRSGEYLLTLINDVLDLARIESNRIELYHTDFSLTEFLENIAGLFRMRAEQKGISFLYEPLTALPLGVRGDEKRLRQVLINLLSNAVKFTDSGGVALKVGYQDQRLRFQVEDTGIGIDEAELGDIFEPFRQVGDQRYRADGAGLGLAITHNLVELMGGELQVSSKAGAGSLFWFALDLPRVDSLIPRAERRQPVIVGYHGPRQRILAIDDRQENRAVLKSLLTPLGFEVLEAANGEQGLHLAQQESPDLVLTDLVMPVLDGFEVVRRLRRENEGVQVPVIAVSASVFDYHQSESLAAGCNAFIPKPIRAEHLLEAIREQLGLEWILENPVTTAAASVADTPAEAGPTVGPSPAEASRLLDLTRQGDVTGVQAVLGTLEQQPALQPFVAQAQTLAAEFQLEEVEALVLPWVASGR